MKSIFNDLYCFIHSGGGMYLTQCYELLDKYGLFNCDENYQLQNKNDFINSFVNEINNTVVGGLSNYFLDMPGHIVSFQLLKKSETDIRFRVFQQSGENLDIQKFAGKDAFEKMLSYTANDKYTAFKAVKLTDGVELHSYLNKAENDHKVPLPFSVKQFKLEQLSQNSSVVDVKTKF
ncbi:hypothetical protein L3V83_06435 [Thiotrichales bacterium 19X7-9]|nr:hypothetical protein [Thiotrichales bacterium 19X7-9]